MYKYCHPCRARTLWVWKHCSLCLRKEMEGDPLAIDTLERKVSEVRIRLQLDSHPEVGEEE